MRFKSFISAIFLIGALSACGSEEEGTVLAVETAALHEMGVQSVLVQAFLPLDAEGEEVDCDVLLDNPSDTSSLVQAGSSVLEDVNDGDASLVLMLPELSPGETWFLVIGFSDFGGGGSVVAAGCGRAIIERGLKATVVVRMEEVD